MTAVTNNAVYIVGKPKTELDKQPTIDAKMIAESIARIEKFIKK